MHLYTMCFDSGKMGRLHGLFILTDEGVKALQELIAEGTEIDFGESLGKHSSVVGPLEDREVARIEATPEQIATMLDVFYPDWREDQPQPLSYSLNGYNPFDYL